jgi:hypothetical protein
MARYIKHTVSAEFKDHRPAMVPGIPAAVRDAELRAQLEALKAGRK